MMSLTCLQKPDRKWKQPTGTAEAHDGGIKRHFSSVNAGVCVFLFAAAYLLRFRNDGNGSLWILYLVPGGKLNMWLSPDEAHLKG